MSKLRNSNARQVSQVEVEGSTPQYEGTLDDYLEMFIQFGYVTLFRYSTVQYSTVRLRDPLQLGLPPGRPLRPPQQHDRGPQRRLQTLLHPSGKVFLQNICKQEKYF